MVEDLIRFFEQKSRQNGEDDEGRQNHEPYRCLPQGAAEKGVETGNFDQYLISTVLSVCFLLSLNILVGVAGAMILSVENLGIDLIVFVFVDCRVVT